MGDGDGSSRHSVCIARPVVEQGALCDPNRHVGSGYRGVDRDLLRGQRGTAPRPALRGARPPRRNLAGRDFNKALTLEAGSLPAFEAVSGVSNWSLTLTGEGEPIEITGTLVSANHFRLVGVVAAIGRTFYDEETLPGRADVVVLSHALWVRAFGPDPAVLGRSIGLAGAEYDRRTIIGVMPKAYRPVFDATELWIPLEHDPALTPEADNSWYVNYRVARLASGATATQANQQVARFAADVQRRLPTLLEEEAAQTAGVESMASFAVEGLA